MARPADATAGEVELKLALPAPGAGRAEALGMARPADATAVEVELKLALPASLAADPAGRAARIAAVPALARRKLTQQAVYSIYYDSPAQALWQQRAALRLRRVGAAG